MFRPQDGVGEYGQHVPGPPWVLGHRGSPHEAPENTLVSLRRAIDLGLDGVSYDVQPCASGEPVLIHDETLERTTDAHGPVSLLTMPELAGIDAGSWFHKSFGGEPLPLLEEALELPGAEAGSRPQHRIHLEDPRLVDEVARQLHEVADPLSVRVASFRRDVCRAARDLELDTMLLVLEASADDLAFARDERLAAVAAASGGWTVRNADGVAQEWPCERWGWSVDEPDALLAAARAPLFGFDTNEPQRALAARALALLASHDDGSWPLRTPALEVEEHEGDGRHGQWSGRWNTTVEVRNPFAFQADVALAVAVRGGAFEVEGLPLAMRLAPGERREVGLRIAGGSWSPCEDPALFARFAWRSGPGRPEESLVLDAPLARIRSLRLEREVRRVPMLRERPEEPYASMSVRRRGRELLAWIEDPGGLTDVRATVRLGPLVRQGGRGVRVPLPPRVLAGGEELARNGLPFSVGFEGREAGRRGTRLRRWAGGLPRGLRAGAAGRLFLGGRG